jgi:hypothetical protein
MSGQPTIQECTRRWFTTWGSCPCPDCTVEWARRRKHHEAGIAHRVSSAEAWAVLERMIDQGWSNSAIATACGIPERSAYDLTRGHRQGHRRRIGPGIAHRIVNHGQPAAGYVSAIGSTRRLRALACLGWRLGDIADTTGVSPSTLSLIQRGKGAVILATHAAAIVDGYTRLQHEKGPSEVTSARAYRNKWAPPAAWDDPDDLTERPKGLGLRGGSTSAHQKRRARPEHDQPGRCHRPPLRPECGTKAGYERHKRNKEARCDPCLDWVRRYDDVAA